MSTHLLDVLPDFCGRGQKEWLTYLRQSPFILYFYLGIISSPSLPFRKTTRCINDGVPNSVISDDMTFIRTLVSVTSYIISTPTSESILLYHKIIHHIKSSLETELIETFEFLAPEKHYITSHHTSTYAITRSRIPTRVASKFQPKLIEWGEPEQDGKDLFYLLHPFLTLTSPIPANDGNGYVSSPQPKAKRPQCRHQDWAHKTKKSLWMDFEEGVIWPNLKRVSWWDSHPGNNPW